MQNSDTIKYIIYTNISADGIIERPDVVGAIFGQTEGLLGDEMDLRELQKTGRIGRIDVNIQSKMGKSKGTIQIPSSLDKTETAILAAALETIDRVGPCGANIAIDKVEDVRSAKRRQVIDRAKLIVKDMFDEGFPETTEIMDEVKQSMRVEEITFFGDDELPAGPNVANSDAILVVEGRADVLNLLRYGIKNAIAVEGTNIPAAIGTLSKKKTVTAFTDGDRGGELIIKELLQVADVDYVARAPNGKGVEELTQKEVIKALRNKVPVEQAKDMFRNKRSEPRKTKSDDLDKRAPKKKVLTLRRGGGKKAERTSETEKVEDKKDNDILRSHADQLAGTLNARLLDQKVDVLREVAVRDLADVLKEMQEDVKCIVFDGVVTQRVVDIAAEKNVARLIGVKVGNLTKTPASVKVMTIDDL